MDPESARRSAEERFGDLGEVFGACRTEKLKDRIMLQRILFVLVFVLTAAVVVQAFVIRGVREDVAAMTDRIEESLDYVLLLGARDAAPTTRMWAASDPWGSSSDELPEGSDGTRDELDAALRRGDADAFERAVRIGPEAVPELAALLRDRTFDAALRFSAAHALGEIGVSWSGHRETPLRRGDRVLVEDAFHSQLRFSGEVNAEGNLSVPELGFVPAEGRTRGQIERHLQRELETYFAQVDLQVSKEAWPFAVLIEALADPDVFVRLAAAQALGEIGDLRARRALLRVAEHDPEQAVRESAAASAKRFH